MRYKGKNVIDMSSFEYLDMMEEINYHMVLSLEYMESVGFDEKELTELMYLLKILNNHTEVARHEWNMESER